MESVQHVVQVVRDAILLVSVARHGREGGLFFPARLGRLLLRRTALALPCPPCCWLRRILLKGLAVHARYKNFAATIWLQYPNEE